MKTYKVTKYMGHVIYMAKTDSGEWVYMYAKHRNGTDEYFSTLQECYEDIERNENN